MTRSLTAMSLLVLAGCLHEKDPSAYIVRDDQPRVSDAPPAAGGSDGALDGASEGSDSDVEDPIVPTTSVPSIDLGVTVEPSAIPTGEVSMVHVTLTGEDAVQVIHCGFGGSIDIIGDLGESWNDLWVSVVPREDASGSAVLSCILSNGLVVDLKAMTLFPGDPAAAFEPAAPHDTDCP